MYIQYQRKLAVNYANQWWEQPNSAFPYFAGDDCSNYISQCLHAGGAPFKLSADRYRGWWIEQPASKQARWSVSWAVAHSLHWFLRTNQQGLRGKLVSSVQDLQIGDLIQYDWTADGRINHSAMITAFDSNGKPLVNAHTRSARQREWTYQDSPAWSKQTVYYFMHIIDDFR